jgi:hypothetical protein
MKFGFLIRQFGDQLQDPLNGQIVIGSGCEPTIADDLFVNLIALAAHKGSSRLGGSARGLSATDAYGNPLPVMESNSQKGSLFKRRHFKIN